MVLAEHLSKKIVYIEAILKLIKLQCYKVTSRLEHELWHSMLFLGFG
jgi:hypothetical protein